MPKAVFTMKLEPALRAEFMAEAAADQRPASQVMRELMRDYVKSRRAAREYDSHLQHKVEIARTQREVGRHVSNDEIEKEAMTRRAKLLSRTNTDNG